MGSYYSFFQAILPPENLGPVLQQWNKLNIKGLQQNIVVQVEQLFFEVEANTESVLTYKCIKAIVNKGHLH